MARPRRRRMLPSIDPHRVVQALRGPGVDTRTWIATARIDDDDDASRWDAEHGWLVDVTFVGGPLDGEGPVTCKVASPIGGAEQGDAHPPPRGCEAVVVLPEGDPNVMPVIVGYVNNADGCRAPGEVQGEELDEDLARATHLRVTNGSLRWQVGELLALQGETVRVVSNDVELTQEAPTQSYVRGEDLQSALNQFAGQVQTAVSQLAPVGPPSTPVTAGQVATAIGTITAAVAALTGATYLSQRIKGE